MRFVTYFSFRSFVFSLDPVVEIEDEVIDCVMEIVNLKSDVNSPRSIRVSFLVLDGKSQAFLRNGRQLGVRCFFNAVECNLTESTTKDSLCSLEGLWNGYAHAPVHSPMSAFLRAQRCYVRHLRQCVPLRFAVFVRVPALVHALS